MGFEKSFGFALACSLVAAVGHGQALSDTQIDSIQKVVQTHPADSLRLRGFMRLAAHYKENGDLHKVSQTTEQAMALAKKLGNANEWAEAHNILGLAFYQQGRFEKALEQYLTVLHLRDSLADQQGRAMATNNIGNVFFNLGNLNKATEYWTRAKDLFTANRDSANLAITLNNLGNAAAQRGMAALALEHYQASLDLREKLGKRKATANTHINMGLIMASEGNFAEAEKHLQLAKTIHEEFGSKKGELKAQVALTSLYLKQKKVKKARETANQALAMANQLGALDDLRDTYRNLSNCDSLERNWMGAFLNYQHFKLYDDSINGLESRNYVEHLTAKYESDKKDAEIDLLSKDNELKKKEVVRQKVVRNSFMAGFGLMIAFAGIVVFQRNRLRKERDRSEELLLNILPAEVANELKAKGESEAKLIEDVTVLFTDFKGFSAISEKLSPKELVADLNECFTAFDSICTQYGIEKIKTIGDSYMAAGGLPSPSPDHAQRVVKAALEMAAFVNGGKQKKIDRGLPYFEVRIGIHTGPVVAGIVGVKKFQYDIWGDTVNTASRMESSGEVGKVNISEATYDLVKNDFGCEYRGEVEAKGKGKMAMYFVAGTQL